MAKKRKTTKSKNIRGKNIHAVRVDEAVEFTPEGVFEDLGKKIDEAVNILETKVAESKAEAEAQAEASNTLDKARTEISEKKLSAGAGRKLGDVVKSDDGSVIGIKVGYDDTVTFDNNSLWDHVLKHQFTSDSGSNVTATSNSTIDESPTAVKATLPPPSFDDEDWLDDDDYDEYGYDDELMEDDEVEAPPPVERTRPRGHTTYRGRPINSRSSSSRSSNKFYEKYGKRSEEQNCTVASTKKRCWKCEKELPNKTAEETLCPECFKKAEGSISMHSL